MRQEQRGIQREGRMERNQKSNRMNTGFSGAVSEHAFRSQNEWRESRETVHELATQLTFLSRPTGQRRRRQLGLTAERTAASRCRALDPWVDSNRMIRVESSWASLFTEENAE